MQEEKGDVSKEFKDVVTDIRLHTKWLGTKLWNFRKEVIALQGNKDITLSEATDLGEVIANLTLAYRAMEDASMRLGKGIQAWDGGESVYDKTTMGPNQKDNGEQSDKKEE